MQIPFHCAYTRALQPYHTSKHKFNLKYDSNHPKDEWIQVTWQRKMHSDVF
jgi:hypothetical protein